MQPQVLVPIKPSIGRRGSSLLTRRYAQYVIVQYIGSLHANVTAQSCKAPGAPHAHVDAQSLVEPQSITSHMPCSSSCCKPARRGCQNQMRGEQTFPSPPISPLPNSIQPSVALFFDFLSSCPFSAAPSHSPTMKRHTDVCLTA